MGGDVLRQVREAWGRARPEGDAEPSVGHVQIQELWDLLGEGLQKQLIRPRVQRKNDGCRD